MKKYANAFLKWITSILEVVIAFDPCSHNYHHDLSADPLISAFVRPESVSRL